MGVVEIRRLKQLEEENANLKRLVADLSLDKTMLQDVLRKRSGEARPSPGGGTPPSGRVLHATSQRCRVHFMRNALAHAGKGHRRLVSAWIGTAFTEADAEGAKRQRRTVADHLRPRVPKLAALMDAAEEDVLAFMAFPREHRAKIRSTNPLERVNCEIKRRTDVVGIFSNEDAVTCLVGAILLEQNDEWAVQRRYMSLETLAPISDAPNVSLPAVAS
jgi:putative transposase